MQAAKMKSLTFITNPRLTFLTLADA